MKRLIIICEGKTEQTFCKSILAPYFLNIGVSLVASSIDGEVSWDKLKKTIEDKLKADKSVNISTMIDYYGLFSRHNFPKWDLAESMTKKESRLYVLEQAMLDAIDKDLQRRFIPYIQLHEFEALLFSNIEAFKHPLIEESLIDIRELQKVFTEFPNPEMINDDKETSPSHRIQKIIRQYDKIIHGIILAEIIGLEHMRAKAPRFNEWIRNLEKCF